MWRLLPLWLEVLEDLGIEPIAVIPFRNPLEIAASLAQRRSNARVKGIASVFLRLSGSGTCKPGNSAAFCRYDRLLNDLRPFARRLAQIPTAGASLPSRSGAIVIKGFLTAELYHHRFNREQMDQRGIPEPVVELFDGMKAAESGADTKLYDLFDRLRANADTMVHLYNGYLSLNCTICDGS